MNDDKTLINRVWWLKRILDTEFKDREYKDITELSEEACKEIDDIVEHIKTNY